MKNLSIRAKFSILVFTLVTIAVIASSIVAYDAGRTALRERYQENLALLAKNKALEVELMLQGIHENLNLAASSDIFAEASSSPANSESEATFASFQSDDSGIESTDNGLFDDPAFMEDTPDDAPDYTSYLNELKSSLPVKEIYLTGHDGVIVSSTNPSHNSGNFPDPSTVISHGAAGSHTSDIFSNRFYVVKPVRTSLRSSLLIFEVEAERINAIMLDTLGLGTTGELLLVSAKENTSEVTILNRLRNKPADSVEVVHATASTGQALLRGIKGETGESFDTPPGQSLPKWMQPRYTVNRIT